MPQEEFLNDFKKDPHPKTNFGIQRLYLIGLIDILPTHEILNILKNYIPFSIHLKIFKYCQLASGNTFLSWTQIKQVLDKKTNLTQCADELIALLMSIQPNQTHCKTFHLGNNNKTTTESTEPTHENTEVLVWNFLKHIYRRNVLCSIIKYIILKDFIQKLTFSTLTSSHKGIFSQILLRLNEIIFETVLLSFNGANYDNYLIMNPLILCLTKFKHTVSLFKKGSSISTIKCTIKRNIEANPNNKKIRCDFTSHLFIKDIRYMVSNNLTLDRLGQLFNIKCKKLVFPYERGISIEALKTATSLDPTNDDFWRDSFKGYPPPLADRLSAQKLFESKLFPDLYQYSVYYLTLDCLLLHSIVLTLFNTYNDNMINIFIRRNYSQSNLSFQELFIVQPSKQIVNNLAPKRINHPFLNLFIRKSVTGGLCTAFVHNEINSNTIINHHLKYVDLNLEKNIWPNFKTPENLIFNKSPAGIVALDIRSLYPSASCEPIPVHTPLIYTRFTAADFKQLSSYSSMLDIKSFCNEVSLNGNTNSDYFKLINKPPRFSEEYNAINSYLATLPTDITVLRFQSSFTALGQCFFGHYPVDALLSFIDKGIHYINIIQYNSVFRHGHLTHCPIPNTEEQKMLVEKTNTVEKNIKQLCSHIKDIFNLPHIIFQYISISECNFKHHHIPRHSKLICDHKKKYTYYSFLQNIKNGTLTGYLLLKNLELKHKNPFIGFLIQKCVYSLKHLSPYTQNLLHHFHQSERVVSLHKASSYIIVSTAYFRWLMENFEFAQTPDIYHAIFFKFENYLKHSIETKLKMRTDIKERLKTEQNYIIKQNLEVQSELIKLCLNSCYGFTLCNVGNTKFKRFKNAVYLPRHKSKTNKIVSSIKLGEKIFLNEYSNPQKGFFNTMLGHVGANILFYSKIILLKRIYFVLKHLNPTKSQILYTDTDSLHILVHHKQLEDNIDENLRPSFLKAYDQHFEKNKLAGIWVNEGFFTNARYIGEKSYILFNTETNKTVSHMKGLNRYFQERFIKEQIDPTMFPHISCNLFAKTVDFLIFKTNYTKNLFQNYVPVKRYFICASGSLPLKINN